MHRQHVYLMRGLPGQGKSTIADILGRSVDVSETVVTVSADHFFTKPDGSYVFDRNMLHMAHGLCQSKYIAALKAKTNIVIVDNTNIKRRDFKFYRDEAEKAGYNFFEITVGNFDVDVSVKRNSHAVPREAIERMAASWEK